MNKQQLLLKEIEAIRDRKADQRDAMFLEGKSYTIDFSILQEEIADTTYLVEKSEEGEEKFTEALFVVRGSTTSSSLYDTISSYLNSLTA